MVRRVAQFVAVVTAVVTLAIPLLACLAPAVTMTAEERECCQKMAASCENSASPVRTRAVSIHLRIKQF